MKEISTNTKMELLNVNEAAEFLKIKVSTLYSWKYYKKIPYVKVYGRLCFDKQELIDFINDKKLND